MLNIIIDTCVYFSYIFLMLKVKWNTSFTNLLLYNSQVGPSFKLFQSILDPM